MLKIYGDIISGNCQKVRWTADRLGLSYEWNAVDILSGGARTEEFLALNPSGQVPAIQLDDGRVLAQSNAIILYLAERHGGDLIPSAPYERAKMYEWLFWEQYSHETAIAVRRFQKLYLKKADREIDPALLDKGAAALRRMEGVLAQSRWMVGDHLNLADIALAAYTRLAPEGGFDLTLYPAIQAWIARFERAFDLPPQA